MKDVIIIHNIQDKASREFVSLYGSRSEVTVLEDDGYRVRKMFPYISAFPTVIIPTPAYTIPGDVTLDENGNELIIPEQTFPASIEYIRMPADWNAVQERIDYWESKVPNWKSNDDRFKSL